MENPLLLIFSKFYENSNKSRKCCTLATNLHLDNNKEKWVDNSRIQYHKWYFRKMCVKIATKVAKNCTEVFFIAPQVIES